jgi:ABC-2 type transport system ATP-binding protein
MSPDHAAAPGVIHAEGLWKRFAADEHYASILQRPSRLFRRRGWRWALLDIDMEVAPGESVGLVGPNGSGKSTLLKLLAGVMYPYAGTIAVGGSVAPLIEVQAGLHPGLTGGENIELTGAFLRVPRGRVRDRFDEIVDFAELGDAIDRPVRFYSSGMRMRLGFAVSTLLDPDVLLIDEVLAVGDASFQQRCLEKLQQARAEGTTLLFVSHDLSAVRAVSDRAVWLERGRVRADGPVDEVLGQYREDVESSARQLRDDGPVHVADVEVANGRATVGSNEPLTIRIDLESDRARYLRLHLGITEGPAAPVVALVREVHVHPGRTRVSVDLPGLPLGRGRYAVWVGATGPRPSDEIVPWHPEADIEITGAEADPAPPGVSRVSPVQVGARWTVEGPG